MSEQAASPGPLIPPRQKVEALVASAFENGRSWTLAQLDAQRISCEADVTPEVLALFGADCWLAGLEYSDDNAPEKAYPKFEQSAEAFRQVGLLDRELCSSALAVASLALVEARLGNLQKAQEIYERLDAHLQQHRTIDADTEYLATAIRADYCWITATALAQRLDFSAAETYVSRACDIASRLVDRAENEHQRQHWGRMVFVWRAYFKFLRSHYAFVTCSYHELISDVHLASEGRRFIESLSEVTPRTMYQDQQLAFCELIVRIGNVQRELSKILHQNLTKTHSGRVSLEIAQSELRLIPASAASLDPIVVRALEWIRAMVANVERMIDTAQHHQIFGRPLQISRKDVFVMMPFAPVLAWVYKDHVAPVIEELNLTIIRADETGRAGYVMADVWAHIRSSRLLIADISGGNPNVFYEVGLAHALEKPVILLQRDDDVVRFDVSHLRIVKYNASSLQTTPHVFARALRNAIRDTLEGDTASGK